MNEGGGVRLVPGLAVRAGQTLAGKYRVEELIGRGPSGVVISAHNIHLREQVTLKILASYTDDQDELVKRRLKKARLASGLKSAHVARIVDIGFTEDGMPYVATESLEGTTLEAELAERGALPVEEAARWVLEACEGLAEAHAAGLLHGDLKPQNIFLARPKVSKRPRSAAAASTEGESLDVDPRVLKILDFGSTSPLDAIGDQSASAFFGSPAFVAPEQIQTPGEVDARADIWALGVLLYNLVSGNLPFEADTLSGVIVAVVYDAPSLLTDAPYELARLVHRCLDKDPAKRPQDVRELAAALAPFAGANGARSSERVGAMLDAGSIAPVSLSASADDDDVLLDVRDVEDPLPLMIMRPPQAEPAPADQATHPSQRVVRQRRRSRARAAAFAVLGGAAITVAAWPFTRSVTLPSMAAMAPAEVSITSAPISAALPAAIPAMKPTELPDAPAATGLSFAASSAESSMPTPLATSEELPPPPTLPFPSPDAPSEAPAPAATPPAQPPRARPASAPARAAAAATTPMRLPPGLPTSRDGKSDGKSDETYLRKLFSDRK